MKKLFWLSAAVLALSPLGIMAHDHAKGEHKHEAAAKGGTMTVEGDILDLACYLGHDGKGEKHAKCARECVLGGAPAGIVDPSGKMYLLVEDHSNRKPYGEMKKLAGERAKVTGRLVERNGLSALVVSEAKKSK